MSDRTAFVTGAGRGIGRAAALALGQAGHAVAIADILEQEAEDVAAELREGGARALAVAVDVTDSEQVVAAVERTAAELGPVDVLVNVAGWDRFKPFVETDERFWRRVIEINFVGCLRTTHAVLPGMMERSWGRIVNVASDAARVGSAHESVYAGAKGAVVAFTKTIAREAARKGVTANIVCPGPTDTALLKGMAEDAPNAERLVEALTRAVPMRRLGRPEEIAGAVAFLASEEAGYITGQTLSVSGGLTMA